ncbi:ADP-ribose pyrophosphatase YjhB (NUDIX family) [Bradyrhizobium sp. GM22.5]
MKCSPTWEVFPSRGIEGLISDFAKGYATPKVDVRGAIVEENKVLLVREKSDGLWALPGGFADVGLSAAQNIAKELYEEAELKVSVRRLYGVRHKAGTSYSPDVRDFYKVFFLCDRLSGGEARPRLETSEAIFFPKDRLPPLSRGRTIESDVEAAFAFAADANRPAFFD